MSTTDQPPTIAPPEFLATRAPRFSRLGRRLFFFVVAARRRHGVGALRVVEQWGDHFDEKTVGRGDLRADITVHDPGAYAALVFGGSRGMGRSYVNGQWSTSDVASLVRLLFRLTQPWRRRLDVVARRGGFFWSRWRRSTSRDEDRDNIHAHYDLSNEFFEIMLDSSMAYSCAIYRDAAMPLHEAQIEKFDRICRKLQLGPGDHVLEIGTGWGGFAMHAAAHYGSRVTTTTISANQRDAARARVAAAGLTHLITVLGDHYGDLTGTYDALVSIEMIEAVSWRSYDEFFATCSALLGANGRMALQAITMNDQSFDRAKLQTDFIRDLIFPGGCLPSVAAILKSTTRVTDLRLIDVDDIGLHYARTLTQWRKAVHEHVDEVTALGFDERFLRLWDLYLGYCEGAFLERHISDVQMVFHKPTTAAVLGYRPT